MGFVRVLAMSADTRNLWNPMQATRVRSVATVSFNQYLGNTG